MFNSKIYTCSPILFQNAILSLRALVRKLLRENKSSYRIEQRISLLEKSKSKLNDYSAKALKDTIENASVNCPFYNGRTDFQQFDYITKNVVLEHHDAFKNINAVGPSINGSTSGTTGAPLTIPQNLLSVKREQAFISRYLKWAGFKDGDRRAWIRGDMIVPIKQKKAPFWRYSYFENMLMLSSFHMSSNALPQYIEAMVEYKTDIIQAYPSSIVTLAKYLDSINEYYPGTLKSITTSSESLSKADKLLVEKRFKCTVFDWYGLFERVAAIGSCEYGRYHIITDYAHIELISAGSVDGQARAEIVGTGFNNSLYPLVRYKTGDHVFLSDEQSCPCGRVYPIIDSVEGRSVDFLIAADGTRVYAAHLCSKGVEGILGCQYVQDQKDHVNIVILPSPLFTDKDKQKIIKNLKGMMGDSMQVDISITDNLLRSKSGKVRHSICTLKV